MAASESKPNAIGHITLDVKPTGERRTGNPCAPFDVAGAGDGPRGTAPAPDPTVDLLLVHPARAMERLADAGWRHRRGIGQHEASFYLLVRALLVDRPHYGCIADAVEPDGLLIAAGRQFTAATVLQVERVEIVEQAHGGRA